MMLRFVDGGEELFWYTLCFVLDFYYGLYTY